MATLLQRVNTDKFNITVEEIDAVLDSLTNNKQKEFHTTNEHLDLINFWLDVRLDIVAYRSITSAHITTP